MKFYMKFRICNNQTGLHFSPKVMQVDLDNTENPVLKKIIAWRMGDPRVIRDK